jgi:hypothetical protein
MGRSKIMFKKKKKPNPLSIAEMSGRLRAFIMDSQIQDGHELSVILGCSALSEELQIHEEQESDKRIEKVDYLVPILYAYSHMLSEASVEFQRSNLPEELKALPAEIWQESRKMMEQVTLSALLGTVSQLVDMGLLEIPRKRK